MTVSIIIPVYNASTYLNECIDSALNQTYDDIEIIAVNDGSTDNSLNILKSYGDRIRYITKNNGGTASALNTGITNMKGEWFKWLSADDVLCPNAVEELISTALILDNKKCILYSNFDYIDYNGNIIKQHIETNYNELTSIDMNSILLDCFFGNGITSMIHKSAFEQYGLFDEDLGFGEDYEMWLRLCVLHGFRLHLIPKSLAKYRVHEAQLTHVKFGKSISQDVKIRKKILMQLDPDERHLYKIAVKKFQRTKPFRVRFRRFYRDLMINVFGERISEKILRFYMTRIKRDI